jgi:hypothetical protein
MWGRKAKPDAEAASSEPQPGVLKEAVRAVRIQVAERSGVVVDLRDAELARLELLNEALDPLFKDLAPDVDLFERGISQGDTPRLWIDAIAHVAMGRDKRQYRFLQDSRYGRKVLAESSDIETIVEAVTRYVATRLIERERALAADVNPLNVETTQDARNILSSRRWRMLHAFLFGLVIGFVALFAALWMVASRVQP